jgi:hypothetical protein
MKGIKTVRILLSNTTVLGIFLPMLPAGFCFLGQKILIKRQRENAKGSLCAIKFSIFLWMTEHNLKMMKQERIF